MTRVRVTHTIGGLARDFRTIQRQAPREMTAVVREGIKVGAELAKDITSRRYSRFGIHYPRSMTATMNGPTSDIGGGGGLVYSGDFGPDPKKKQGGMAFEEPSRNQRRPHTDIARTAMLMGPAFQGEVRRLPDRLFWP